jgi:MtrB/PioB family decaheme-associated outer membrane protein
MCLATMLASATVRAQAAPDMSQWRCRLCPFEHGIEAEYTAGASYASDGVARFADGNGYDRQGGYLLAGGDGRYADEHQRLLWRVDDLGLDARSLSLAGSRSGRLEYRLHYRQLPHYLFGTTATVFREASDERLTLPAGWDRAPVTSQMTALGASLSPERIAGRRDMLEIGVELRPRDRVEVYTDFSRRQRNGTQLTGASFFNTTSQLPAPIDQTTDEWSAGLRYRASHGTLDLGYRGSFFNNRPRVLTWDNPFASPAGAERGALAAAPDNSFQNVTLGGAFRFLEHTALSFSAGIGRGEQDEPLLPYTTNAQLAASALPRAALDGAVDTSHLTLAVSSRPWARLRVRAAYRYDEHDNRTPISVWNRVITDTFRSIQSESNVAYDFERERLNVAADADVGRRLRLSAGYDRTTRDRSRQEVAGQTENGGWGALRWRFAPGFELRARRGTARRDIDRYDTALATELLQNPLLAKYNLAYRFRTYADVTLTAAGVEHPFTFAVSAAHADDDYTKSRLGLVSDEDRRIAVDFGWTFTARVSFYASASDEKIDALQRGSESFAAPDWSAAQTDAFRTFAAGLRLEQTPPRFDLTVDVSRADGATATDLASASGSGPFPRLSSKLDSLRFEAHYHRSDRVSVLMQLRYERLATQDWALAGVEPATMPGLLALGADPYQYDVFVLGGGVTVSLGR